jgi:hypothetical protein
MSKVIQTQAQERLEAARRREQNALERARRNAERGDLMVARVHRESAQRQASSAERAEVMLRIARRFESHTLADDA